MAILWPKIGQRHFGARASHGHNLAIFHPILTNEHTKMTNSLRQIEWNKKLSSMSVILYIAFLAPFLLYTRYPIVARALGLAAAFRPSASREQRYLAYNHFCSEASHRHCCTYGLKTTLKLLVHVLAIMASSYLKIVFLQKSGLITHTHCTKSQ